MLKCGFLDAQERADCLRIVKDGREEQRFSRRAHVLLLLDRGMSFEEVASVLFLDDSTVRTWRKAYEDASGSSSRKGSGSTIPAPA